MSFKEFLKEVSDKKLDEQIADAIVKANEAFWASIVESFPQVESGDFDPAATDEWEKAMQSAVNTWINMNLPGVADDTADPYI